MHTMLIVLTTIMIIGMLLVPLAVILVPLAIIYQGIAVRFLHKEMPTFVSAYKRTKLLTLGAFCAACFVTFIMYEVHYI
jgi:hypothetical protein